MVKPRERWPSRQSQLSNPVGPELLGFGMSPPQRPLYFWHIPKTAGTSFIEWLDGHFSASEIFAPQLLPQLRATEDGDVRGRLLYRGHLGSELPRRAAQPLSSLTLLRDPRARTLSHLGHIWREPNHYLHERLRGVGSDLAAVLTDPVLRRSVSNVQARYLAVDPASTDGRPLPLPVPAALLQQAQFELAPLPAHGALISRALIALLRMGAVGFAEDLDAFAARVSDEQGWPAPGPLSRSNVGPTRSSPWRLHDLTRADTRTLDSVNRADRAVYRAARQASWAKARLLARRSSKVC